MYLSANEPAAPEMSEEALLLTGMGECFFHLIFS